jgi:lysophospholipase L1-like esterase
MRSILRTGGVVAVLALAAYGARELLHRQAQAARRLIGKPLGEEALDADRIWRRRYARPDVTALDLLVLGDSIAAGLGAERRKETFGARLAIRLATATRRPVRLRTEAVVGAESSALGEQVARLEGSYRADVAVIVVGGNDVTHRVPVSVAVRHLEDAVTALQARGIPVVVGTCPDLGALRAVAQPLRGLGGLASRQLAVAQRNAVVRRGAYAVSLGRVVGPQFVSNPEEMFGLDRFHPSPLAYKRTAKAMLPSVLAAMGFLDDLPDGHHGPRQRPF